mmetsp:Transcript_1488/g.3136  ORF Transcript_1488/g.3136 Transcript_1488/m.3136 type:complete len:1133 (-) Transcript_1488:44-3442(-)
MPEARTTVITPSPHATTNNVSNNNINENDNNHHAAAAGRRLLSSSYRSFLPADLGDRYVTFLLQNERTMPALQHHVLMDHLAVIRQLGGGDSMNIDLDNVGQQQQQQSPGSSTAAAAGGEENKKKRGCANASIEIDAFQLLSLDPVLGNLTLRYPDTLLELLEDATVQARRVLRRRMEMALRASLDKRKRQKSDMSIKNEVYNKETNDMKKLHSALQRTSEWYDPRPLHARLVHLPPHMQCCKPTLSSISSADVGTVVQICGTCVRTGPVRMMETSRTYQCLGKGCGCQFSVNADFGTTNNALPQPIVCPSDSDNFDERCNSTSFEIVQSMSEHADYQEMKVQESASALTRVGSVPRSILIKLSDDLVDRCNPGDEVVVVGSLHAEWQNQSVGPGVEVMVGMSMRAHSVRVINIDEEFTAGGSSSMADLGLMGGGSGGMRAMAASSGNLREKFRREFDLFWSDDAGGARRRPIGTRDYIVRAVCPKLYGMHAVKLGLLLVLIGGALVSSADGEEVSMEEEGKANMQNNEGVQIIDPDEDAPVAFKFGDDDKNDDDLIMQEKKKPKDAGKQKQNKKNGKAVKARRRIQSHILLIGDPGTGKSQFLRFAAALSPRSVLTTGTGSSTAGLTCAAVRDSSTGSNGNEFSLEAGALALADRGVCCIDEFGCMSKEDRTSIHEAMEQQTISVAKAGIICKLNARASVVAVMNPTGGIYATEYSLEHNSRLGSALLSRFDLIFIMVDQADAYKDEKVASFLLQQSITPGSGYDRPLSMDNLFDDDTANGHWGMEKLRAYIATIRDKFQPTLTPEASKLLEDHYSLCRQRRRDGQSLITVRFLESLIRLSQAHARLMYRDKVLEDDAVAVILLMESTSASCDQFDDLLNKNPIDTEFKAFDKADAIFEDEKKTLLRRYRDTNSNDDGMSQQSNEMPPPSFFPSATNRHEPKFKTWDDSGQRNAAQFQTSLQHDGQGRNNLMEDQWGRRMLSQVASPYPSSQRKTNPNQYTPAPSHESGGIQPSANRVTFSQQGGSGTVDNRAETHSNTHRGDPGYYSQRQQGDYPSGGNPNGERPQSGGFLREDGRMVTEAHTQQEWESSHGQMLPLSQQVEGFHGNHVGPGKPNNTSSGTRRKKRRTAD